MKRKIAVSLIAIILVCVFCALTVSADGQGTFCTGIIPAKDNTFLLPVSVRDNPGIATLRLKLNYNDAATLIGVGDTGELVGFAGSESVSEDSSEKSYTMVWVNSASTDLKGSAYLAWLTFKLNEGKTIDDFSYSLNFNKEDVLNSSLEIPDFVVIGNETEDGPENPENPKKPSTVMFDSDADGSVTSADALNALKASVGIIETNPLMNTICDTDGSYDITSADALYILKYSVGIVQ